MTQILVVADTLWVVNQTRSALAGPSNDLCELADPHQLLDAALEFDPDITIVDMQIGSMGGMAIVRMFRDAVMAGELQSAPIMLLLDRSADEFLAKRAGADGWLIKPFTAQDLTAKVAALLPISESA